MPGAEADPTTIDVRPLLAATGLEKSYAGVRALRRVSLDVRAGEVHAVVGENGAGKSTLIRILAGAIAPDAGTLEVAGEPVTDFDPLAARRRGIAVIYQQPTLFPHLTVAENLAIADDAGAPFRRIDGAARHAAAVRLLDLAGARIEPGTLASALSIAEQQLVEIARALGHEARIVIMDEPTASLTAREADRLLDTVRSLRAGGAGVIYISHRLEEVFSLADRITVLRDGERVATAPAAELTRDRVIAAMIGRPMTGRRTEPPVRADGDVALELRGLGQAAAGVRDVSLTLRAGEILGLGGLVGAGRSELARTLFGLTPADSGEIRLFGRPIRIASPGAAIAAGIAYLPEDRRRHGVVGELRVDSNLTLASLPRLMRAAGWLDRRVARAKSEGLIRALDVRPPSLSAVTWTLSGGNQQKVALGRWLMTAPRVLILDEPTQGVDVGAKSEIHAQVEALAGQGVAVLLVSSDLPELLALSHRVLVMRRGAIAGELGGDRLTAEAVMRLALTEPAA